jgi:hypothetical protein
MVYMNERMDEWNGSCLFGKRREKEKEKGKRREEGREGKEGRLYHRHRKRRHTRLDTNRWLSWTLLKTM